MHTTAHTGLEPDNWADLLQAITFLSDEETDPEDALAWTREHQNALDIWAEALERCALALDKGYTHGIFTAYSPRTPDGRPRFM